MTAGVTVFRLARTTDDGARARLAAALARCWAYAGQAPRAIRFAEEAVERAQRVGAMNQTPQTS